MPGRKPPDRTRGEKVIAFIEEYLRVPEGVLLGQKVELLDFQKKFILAVYDNPHGTSRAYLSIARKNAKTATIAMMALAHIVGPEAFTNSRIISGAQSRKQAAEVYNYAAKMVMASPRLRDIIRMVPSQHMLVGLPRNVQYQAIAAEAKGAHGGSPIVAILDEVGQVRGPNDPFITAIETAQGAYDGQALLIAISTQAATDADLFSIWLDDAAMAKDPHIVSHLYTAPKEADLQDRAAWAAANPALGVFRSLSDVEEMAERAVRMPTSENTFRWLYLNQRVEANSPFVSANVWDACGGDVLPLEGPVYGGLDLSSARDLTALVLIGEHQGVWQVHPTFWLPGDGLAEKSRADRVPYDVWERQGHLIAAPGRAIEYEYVAAHLLEVFENFDIQKIAFDRWGWKFLRTWLLKAGFSDQQLDEHFVEIGQGYQSASPALRDLETDLLNGKIAHGNHPVLKMCAANAVTQTDPAGNRKLAKDRSAGRIDGLQALWMARAAAGADAAAEIDIMAMVA